MKGLIKTLQRFKPKKTIRKKMVQSPRGSKRKKGEDPDYKGKHKPLESRTNTPRNVKDKINYQK